MAVIVSSHPIVVQSSAGVVQVSFLRENLFSFRLVGESVGESIDFLAGEGKRSRYTLSPDDGLGESWDLLLVLESVDVRTRLEWLVSSLSSRSWVA